MMARPVKIMHLVLNLDVGGLEWVVVNLLKELIKKDYSPSVVCLVNGGNLVKDLEKLGIEVEILNKPNKLDFSISFKLAGILRRKNIALLHTHNTGAFLYGSIAAKLAGTTAIVHTEHGRNFPDKKRLMLAEKILSIFTYRIITVSRDLKNCLIDFENISSQKITVIPNGVDLDLFKLLPPKRIQKKRNELGLSKDNYVIGTIGRLVEVKDHKNLIKAFNFVRRSITNAKLIIVGDGPLKEQLKHLSQSLGMEKDVLFLGERNDTVELLNTFDVFTLPSKSEGISLTLLEAMATKRPIIATCVGGNREIVKDGEGGCLIPPNSPHQLAEAILDIVKNSEKAKQITHFAYDKVKKEYSLAKMVNDYQKIYEAALSKN